VGGASFFFFIDKNETSDFFLLEHNHKYIMQTETKQKKKKREREERVSMSKILFLHFSSTQIHRAPYIFPLSSFASLSIVILSAFFFNISLFYTTHPRFS